MNNYRRVRGFEYCNPNFREHFEKVREAEYRSVITFPEFPLPRRATSRSAGYDLHSPIDFTIPAEGEYFLYLDIKAYMLADEFLSVHMRSGHGKLKIRFANVTGIIDADFYSNPKNDGNMAIYFLNESNEDVSFKRGERIAQAIFQKYLLADNDEPILDERLGGHGHSDGRVENS